MANSDSVAEGEIETIRLGMRGIVTLPLAATTVTGKSAGRCAAGAVETSSGSVEAVAARSTRDRRSTNPPFREGFGLAANGRSSDSGLPLHRLPGPGGQWRVGGGHLPSQRRDRPGLAPGSLSVRRLRRRDYHRPNGPEESRFGVA